jgi:hypothetical protein
VWISWPRQAVSKNAHPVSGNMAGDSPAPGEYDESQNLVLDKK